MGIWGKLPRRHFTAQGISPSAIAIFLSDRSDIKAIFRVSSSYRRRRKEEGRRQKEEGRRKKAEGRRQKEEGRRKEEEGRRKKEEAIKLRVWTINKILTVDVAISVAENGDFEFTNPVYV